MRLIDADALIPMMKYATTDNEIGVFPIKIGFDAIVKVINDSPTIEPERKTGRWIPDNNSYYETKFVCSACGESETVPTTGFTRNEPLWDFCPNCGADMRGDKT